MLRGGINAFLGGSSKENYTLFLRPGLSTYVI